MRLSFFLLVFCSITIGCHKNRCSITDYENALISQFPEIKINKANAESIISSFNQESKKTLRGTQDYYFIPTVVHVIGSSAISKISIQDINTQISILNNKYAEADFEFCLVQADQNGNSTNGINFISQNIPEIDPSNTSSDAILKSIIHWPSDKFLNIYVVELSNSSLGYATFPWVIFSQPHLDGVVIDADNFGLTTDTPYDMGITLIHEIGHWIGLYHTFQRGEDNIEVNCLDDDCGQNGDKICDTAPCNVRYGCPSNSDSCPGGQLDPTNNYMSYTDDNCMNKFTTGQVNRMKLMLQNFRSGLLGCDGGPSTVPNNGCSIPGCKSIVLSKIKITVEKDNGLFGQDDVSYACLKYTPSDCVNCPKVNLILKDIVDIGDDELGVWVDIGDRRINDNFCSNQTLFFVLYENDNCLFAGNCDESVEVDDCGDTIYISSRSTEYGYIKIHYNDFNIGNNFRKTYTLAEGEVEFYLEQ